MFGERFPYAGFRATLSVGAVPRAESPGSAALNKDELRSYRKLLASSDDLKNSAPKTVRLVQVQ
jgi:hypothetical protein